MKKLLAVVAVLVLALGVSNAFAFDWGDYAGPITLQFSGFTNGNLPTNSTIGDGIEDGWGIGRVSAIYQGTSAAGPLLWQNAQSNGNEDLLYNYYGIEDWNVAASSELPNTNLLYSLNGTFDFYLLSNYLGDLSTASVAAITGGSKLARFNLVPGIVSGDSTTTMFQQYDNALNYFAGSGRALASVDLTGDWDTSIAQALNNNAYTNGADLTMGFVIDGNTISNGYALTHDGKGNSVVTPEPISSTLFLLGGGALVAGRLRKKNRKS